MSLPSPQLPTPPDGPTDREPQLLKAIRERDATACSRLVRQWVHRHGTASLDSFTEITVTLHEGPEARDWLLLQLCDPFPAVAPASEPLTPSPSARRVAISPSPMVVEPQQEQVSSSSGADVSQPFATPPPHTAAESFTGTEPLPTPQLAPSPAGAMEEVGGSETSEPEPDQTPPLEPAMATVAAAPIGGIPLSQESGGQPMDEKEKEQGRQQELISSEHPSEQPATDPWALPSLADLGFGSQDFTMASVSTPASDDITMPDGGISADPEPTPTAQAGPPSPLTRGWASLRQVRSSLRNWFADTMESLRDEDLPIDDGYALETRADVTASSGGPSGQNFSVELPLTATSFLDSSLPPLSLPLGDPPPASVDTGQVATPPTPEAGAEEASPSDQGPVHPKSPTLPPVGPPAPAPPALNDLRAWLPDADTDTDSGTGLPKAS